MDSDTLPILYSLHNCPYAIRARIALLKARQQVLIRSIKLDNKPHEMLQVSPKGSVPVLVVPGSNTLDGNESHSGASEKTLVIEESLEVMLWALSQSDPENLLRADKPEDLPAMLAFIESFERNFIPALNAFSCAKRYHEENMPTLRQACAFELEKLETCLSHHPFLFAHQESLVDIALLPFLRKFARTDKQWFRQCPYPKLRAWLNDYLQSPMFSKVMERQELWMESRKDVYLSLM